MSACDKVSTIFRELAGEAANRLDVSRYPADVNTRITSALIRSKEAAEVLAQDQIGFHLVDWQADAAFIVALCLYPERFTDEEVQEGVDAFLVHAPSHVVAAAKAAGYPINDLLDDEKKA